MDSPSIFLRGFFFFYTELTEVEDPLEGWKDRGVDWCKEEWWDGVYVDWLTEAGGKRFADTFCTTGRLYRAFMLPCFTFSLLSCVLFFLYIHSPFLTSRPQMKWKLATRFQAQVHLDLGHLLHFTVSYFNFLFSKRNARFLCCLHPTPSNKLFLSHAQLGQKMKLCCTVYVPGNMRNHSFLISC